MSFGFKIKRSLNSFKPVHSIQITSLFFCAKYGLSKFWHKKTDFPHKHGTEKSVVPPKLRFLNATFNSLTRKTLRLVTAERCQKARNRLVIVSWLQSPFSKIHHLNFGSLSVVTLPMTFVSIRCQYLVYYNIRYPKSQCNFLFFTVKYRKYSFKKRKEQPVNSCSFIYH